MRKTQLNFDFDNFDINLKIFLNFKQNRHFFPINMKVDSFSNKRIMQIQVA